MTRKPVTVTSSTGTSTTYRSVRATSRVLSGLGLDFKKDAISRRCRSGGGVVNGTFVKFAK